MKVAQEGLWTHVYGSAKICHGFLEGRVHAINLSLGRVLYVGGTARLEADLLVVNSATDSGHVRLWILSYPGVYFRSEIGIGRVKITKHSAQVVTGDFTAFESCLSTGKATLQ